MHSAVGPAFLFVTFLSLGVLTCDSRLENGRRSAEGRGIARRLRGRRIRCQRLGGGGLGGGGLGDGC